MRAFGGNDVLEGRAAADALYGGTGSDTASYRHAPVPVIANLASPGGIAGDAAGDTYTSIENIIGSNLGDTLTGNGLPNWIDGINGNDTLSGAGGDDRLDGGRGLDAMTGGEGADIFRFRSPIQSSVGALRDQIIDFNAGTAGTSIDKINLQRIDAKTDVTGNQAFTFIGTAAFSGTSGQLRIELIGAATIVSGDVNGDRIADFEIALLNFTDLANLTAIDFLR